MNELIHIDHDGRITDAFDVLGLAVEIATNGDLKKAENLVEIAKDAGSFSGYRRQTFWNLCKAVEAELFYQSQIRHGDYNPELRLQRKFNSLVSELIPGASMAHVKTDGENIPDAFIQIGEAICPVEVKLKRFDSVALKQLKRYMKAYRAKVGYAVAPELTTPLPRNIKFIQLSL